MSETNGGRNGNGRFQPGNQGGPGRPPRATEREYLSALTEAVPIASWRRIVERAVRDALAGDSRSREWLSKYLVGDPQHDVRLEVCDAGAITALRQQLLHEPEFLEYLEEKHDPNRTTRN